MMEPEPNTSGHAQFTATMITPTGPLRLEINDSFDIGLTLECTGKAKDHKGTAFKAACKMVGTFQVVHCGKDGISDADQLGFWALQASKLSPLVAQFLTDAIVKMGFRNVIVPLALPSTKSGGFKELNPRKKKAKTPKTQAQTK
jgi:hypothetical protein